MIAMILAAGLGTRLGEMTKDRPKALVELSGKPLLEILITKLKKNGIENIVINVHHFSNQIVDFLNKNNNFGINIKISDETSLLLDTAGGIKKAESLFLGYENILVHNVDVISDINLNKFIDSHRNNKSLASLAIRKRKTSRYFLFDKNNILSGWRNNQLNNEIITRPSEEYFEFGFSGVHIINKKVLEFLDDSKPNSITNSYIELSKKYKISGFVQNSGYWFDLGKPENIIEAEKVISI